MNRSTLPLDQVLMRLVRLRLFTPLLIVSLAAIAVAGFFGIQALEDRQQDIVQSRAAMIDQYIDEADNMLGAVVHVAKGSSPEEILTSMQATYDVYGYFDTMYLLDNRSRIVRMVPLDVRYMNMDMSGVPAGVLNGTRSESRISRPFISLRTGNPTVYLVQDLPSGGSVAGELSLDALQQEITAPSGGSSDDFIFLTDQYGTLIAHPSHDLVLQQTNMGNLPIVSQRSNRTATMFYPYEESLVLGSAALVERAGWVVVTQIPVVNAFGTFVLILGLTLIALTGIWLVVAWNLSSRLHCEIVIPLEQLSRGASALTMGDFNLGTRSLPPAGAFAELDQLTDDFRQMNSAIQERQRALEENRNELEHSNSELQAAYERLKADEEHLQKKIDELERFARVVTNRELKMIELKEKIRQLEREKNVHEEIP